MTLFLLISLPVWLLLVESFYNTRDWARILKFFFGGLCIGMPILLISLSLLTRTPFRMDMFGLFWWAWIRGTGLPMLLAIPIILISCIRNPNPYSRILDIAAFLSGVALIYNIWHGIMQDPGFHVYRLFISPVVWIGTIGFIAWFLNKGLHLYGAPGYLVLALSNLIPFIINFLPIAYINNKHILSWIISVSFAIVASFLVFLDSQD